MVTLFTYIDDAYRSKRLDETKTMRPFPYLQLSSDRCNRWKELLMTFTTFNIKFHTIDLKLPFSNELQLPHTILQISSIFGEKNLFWVHFGPQTTLSLTYPEKNLKPFSRTAIIHPRLLCCPEIHLVHMWALWDDFSITFSACFFDVCDPNE